MTAFVFWLQKDWMFGEEAAVHFARELENGASFAGLCRSEAGQKMAPAQIWAWRRLHDEYRLLKKPIEACAPRFGSELADVLSVRLACAAPDGLPAGDETRFLAVARVLFALGMQRARVRFVAAGSLPVHPSFSDLLSLHASPGELPSHRVLAAVRAAAAGALHIGVEPPAEELAWQWSLRRDPRWPDALFSSWLQVLPRLLWEETVARARREAVQAAAEVYRGLLESSGMEAGQGAIGLYVGAPRQSIGAVFRDARGQWGAPRGFSPDEKGFSQLLAWCGTHPDVPVAIPASAPDHARLQRLRQALSRRLLIPVRPAALSWSRQRHPGVPAHMASARILLERALDPFDAWSKIPASRLGLAEYQPEIPESLLQPAFSDMVEWVRLQRESGARPAQRGGAVARPVPGALVKRISDLRPGMQLPGVVTSIVPFGAFVNLGLEQDGFIHVSEMGEGPVRDPAVVLQLGQRVLCRVLQVDPEKGRISLSLRPAPETPPRPRRTDAHAQRQKLDLLFKKKE